MTAILACAMRASFTIFVAITDNKPAAKNTEIKENINKTPIDNLALHTLNCLSVLDCSTHVKCQYTFQCSLIAELNNPTFTAN